MISTKPLVLAVILCGIATPVAAQNLTLTLQNPYVSVDPILSRPGVRSALEGKLVIALSPIVGGRAVKGPLAEMIPALAGEPASAAAIARHYGALLGGLVVERGDESALAGLAVHATSTIMKSRDERVQLARECMAFAARVSATKRL